MMFFLLLLVVIVLYSVVLVVNMSAASSFWTFFVLITTIFLISRIPYAYLYEDDHKAAYSDSEYPNVSIIIAVKNEEDVILKTITTCIESQYPGKLECIVIDDGSTDGTRAEIQKAQKIYGEKIKLIVFPENKGKIEAMAVGTNEAQYEIIVFVDSDSFLDPKAIRDIAEHFLEDKRIGAVAGNTKVSNVNTNIFTKMQSIQYAISFDIYKASESVHKSVTCCPGCFSAYRTESILPLAQSWQEQKTLGLKATFYDDRGLTNFALQKGWLVAYCEKSIATTIVPEKFSVYWRQQLRWKKSWLLEGVPASSFMWKKRHPLAILSFYTDFSVPILGPILAASVLVYSIITSNPLLFGVFVLGFLLLGIVFALFIRIYHGSENWYYMPVASLLFVTVFIWQMPWALITLKKNNWGTR